MDDETYYDQLMTKASRTLEDVANDVRKHLSGAVESIIKAGQALQEGRDMHASDNAFHDWCMQEFPELHRKTRLRMMQVGKKFGGTFMSHHIAPTVLYELAAPSVPDELVEDFLSSEEPVKVKEVQAAKAGYNKIKDKGFEDLLDAVSSGSMKPREAAEEAWKRADEKRKEMEKQPKVYDAHAHARSTEHYDLSTSAVNLVVAMEQMSNKSEMEDVIREIAMCVVQDPLGTKVKALHFMREVIEELCVEYPEIKTNLKLVN